MYRPIYNLYSCTVSIVANIVIHVRCTNEWEQFPSCYTFPPTTIEQCNNNRKYALSWNGLIAMGCTDAITHCSECILISVALNINLFSFGSLEIHKGMEYPAGATAAAAVAAIAVWCWNDLGASTSHDTSANGIYISITNKSKVWIKAVWRIQSDNRRVKKT